MRFQRRWQDAALAALLLTATLLAYAPALDGELLLDDEQHVTRPDLRSLAGLARIWTDIGATQQYYPVLHTTFWIEHRLWGDNPFPYHVTNVVLHFAAACLLVPLTRRLGLPGGWLAAFWFALHPVGVESVAWISEQKNTLSAAFAFGAVVAYLKFDDTRAARWYAVSAALFALALLCKTAIATLPVSLLAILWWRHGRLDWKRDAMPLLWWIGASLWAGAITISVERRLIAGIDANVALGWVERWLVAGRAAWFYLGTAFWPGGLTFFHERWALDASTPWQHVLPAGVVLVVGIILLWRPWRGRGARTALLVYGVTLLPILGLVDVEWFVFSYVADHFQYHALPAALVPLAAALARLVPVRPYQALAAALILPLGVMTWRHSRTFHDSVALYGNAVARNPQSVVAHNHLGVALAKFPARLPDAVAEFEAALALNPDAAETHENLGVVLLTLPGRTADAITHLEAAVRLKPSLTRARATLAVAHFDLAKERVGVNRMEAVTHYWQALEHDPAFAEAHYNLGNLLSAEMASLPDAIEHYKKAVQIRPQFVEARTNLGAALVRLPGRLDDAIAQFEAALAIDPGYAPAQNNLRQARALRAAIEGSIEPSAARR